jgi:hypothetical protein
MYGPYKVDLHPRCWARAPESESKDGSDLLWTREPESKGGSDCRWTLDLRARWTSESDPKKMDSVRFLGVKRLDDLI